VPASPSGKGEACIGDLLNKLNTEREREKKVGVW
jgi:hypothetical protein